MRGSALPLMVDTPRRRIVVPAPRLPELLTISRPAISPCKASSAEVNAIPSTSERLKVCCDTDISFFWILRPPELARRPRTVTSLSVVFSSSSLMANVVSSPIFFFQVLLPTYETTSIFLVLFISIEKLPIISVCVAFTIRSLASRSVTLASMTGPMASSTVPDITLPCA